ncbi:UDP-4-amino-4,6-dideoxy-N-acetyl-beta-L-altrosami ne N-acetyltransferase [Aurantivibrio plasticivorans]
MNNRHSIRLKAMSEEHLGLVLSWRNHKEVRKYMYTQREILSHEHALWFEMASKDPLRNLLIFEIENTPLGFVSFTQKECRTIADWGFYLAPDVPKGTGSELGIAALNFSFHELGLHKLCGQVLGYNNRSIRFHLKLGFIKEGVLRQQHYDNLNYHDIHCFGILDSEWKSGENKNVR